jgi:hypothetical protein
MRNTACAALFLALLCNAGLALAGESETVTPDLGRNAALTYWRAFAVSPEMTKDELNIISPRPGTEPPKVPPEKKAQLVEQWRVALELMREVAAVPQCDWGIDYEKDGPGVQLPQLAKARALARAAAFRARYFWEKGQRKDAVDDLRAAVIMARHVGNDGRDTIIGMLVQIAIEGIVQDTTAQLLTNREAADLFADVLGDFSNGSTAHLSENAIRSERKMFIPWMRHRLLEASATDWKRLLASLGDGSSEAAQKLAKLQQADMPKLLDELDKQYTESAVIMALPYQEFRVKMPEMESAIKASGNPLSAIVLPALTRVREEEERYRIRWAMVRAAIEFRREAEGAFNKVTDPHDGKPFQYTALEGGAFELKSALLVRGNQQIVMTFGQLPAVK